MTKYKSYQDIQNHEIIVNQYAHNCVTQPNLFSLLNNMWQYLITALTQGQEPKVWQSTDHLSQILWHAYDPVTDRSVTRDCEAEIRIWLEERYYQ